ncbi:hypothetical protein ACQY0O_006371 [Thecaphora frezii]
MKKTKKMTIMSLFCVQVLLDISYKLQGDVGKGFQDYTATVARMQRSLQRRREDEPRDRLPNWPASNETTRRTLTIS